MSDLKCSSRILRNETQKIETFLEKAPGHVVRSLVGVYGTTGGHVINFIVKHWIMENREMLERMGITFQVKNAQSGMDSIED